MDFDDYSDDFETFELDQLAEDEAIERGESEDCTDMGECPCGCVVPTSTMRRHPAHIAGRYLPLCVRCWDRAEASTAQHFATFGTEGA